MRRTAAALLAMLMICTAGCGKINTPEPPEQDEPPVSVPAETMNKEPETVPTEHVSPLETVTAEVGKEVTVDTVIPYTHLKNTVTVPLSEFIETGDRLKTITFSVSADSNIGTYRTAYQLTMKPDSPFGRATDNMYQTEDFDTPINGKYGEISWEVPADVAADTDPTGNIIFGYWWGSCKEVLVNSGVCTFTRTKEIPCDGTAEIPVNAALDYEDNKTVSIPLSSLPENAVPEVVTYNISAAGGLRKFSGAFGYSSELGSFQESTAMFTDESGLTLTWFVPDEAKNLIIKDGNLMLNYWWSEQKSVDLSSVSVKYSLTGSSTSTLGPEDTVQVADFRSSQSIVDDIKVGWNLGNTLESYGEGISGLSAETAWGNPKVTQELILSVKKAGFNAIRIPVTWGSHMENGRIRPDWMNRVQEIVDYAYNKGMYVILNMHHDDYLWFDLTSSEYPADSDQLKQIWNQISIRFRDYGDRLIFEGLNEARTIGSANEWNGGTPEERKLVNKYIQDFVNTVRATGGNNSKRSLIITTYGASAEEVSLNELTIPKDEHLIISVHYYAPWQFTSGRNTAFGAAEKAELGNKFDFLKSRFGDSGYPLLIDEFGCIAAAPDATRADYYSGYISAAKERGIKCFVWDNGIMSGEDSYGLIDRTKNQWNQTILDGIMNGANG